MNIRYDLILGSKRTSNYLWMLMTFIGGSGFFLAGLSSYLGFQLLPFADTKEIVFIPQGIVMTFYGTTGLLLSTFLGATIYLNVGGGYNLYDKKNKKGKLVYKNIKDSYEGEFLNNNITGKGEYKWENGDVFVGDFINGKMHGRGHYKWPDGGEYEGEYINNIKAGMGKFKWSNGKIYEGTFEDGKFIIIFLYLFYYILGRPHGKGKLTNDVNQFNVEFIEGKMKKKPSPSREVVDG